MRLFYHDTTSYDDASLWCNSAHQGFLTGPDSNDEYANIMNQTRYNVDVVGNLTSSTQTMIIIGLKRRPGCETDPGTNPQCNRPEGFMWQDGLGGTSNTLINQNLNSNPGVETSPTAVRACAGILMVTGDYSYSQNKVYSLDCGNAQRSTGLGSRLVVCGKIGQCPSSPPTTVSTSPGTTTILSSTTTATSTTVTSTHSPSTSTAHPPSPSTAPPSPSTTVVPSTSTTAHPLSSTTIVSTSIPSTTTFKSECDSTVCDNGWFKTKRGSPQQTLCMRLFYHDTTSYDDASLWCNSAHQGFLTGPDSNDEYANIMNQTRYNVDVVGNLTSSTQTMIIIGLKRRPGCETDPGTNPQCNRPEGFMWQDGLGGTSNTLINQNLNSNPGVETSPTAVRACAGILMVTGDYSYSQNKVYSLDCGNAQRSTGLGSRLVVCGKIGQCPSSPPTTVSTSPGTTTILSSTTTATSTTVTSTHSPSTSTAHPPSPSTAPPSTTVVPSTSTTARPPSTTTALSTSVPSTTTFNPGCDATVCDNGWFKTKRGSPQQTLCMRLFYHDTTSYDDASLWCNSAHQGFLTGPDSNDEYANIMNQTRYNVDVVGNLTSSTQTMIIIGLKRRPGCETDPGTNPQCNRPEGFMWQDGLGGTSNTLINQNLNSNPGVETSPTAVRACAGILMVTGDYSYSQNKVYSLDCGNAQRSTGLGSRLVVCGKIGQCPSSPTTTVPTSPGTTTILSSTTTATSTTVTSTHSPSTSTAHPPSPSTAPPSPSTTVVPSTSTTAHPPSTTTTLSTSIPSTTTFNSGCDATVCDNGWFKTKRGSPQQTLCMRLFYHDTSSYDDASLWCNSAHQGFLTGPDSNDEYANIMNQTRYNVDVVGNLTSSTQTMIIIGLKRRPGCETDPGTNPQCNRPEGFMWQDGLGGTSNTLINQNLNSNPGVETSPTAVRACAGILMVTGDYSYSQNKVYSLDCGNAQRSTGLGSRLVVCGKIGQCPSSPPTTVSTSPGTTTILSSTTTATSPTASTTHSPSTSITHSPTPTTAPPTTSSPSTTVVPSTSTTARPPSTTTTLSTSVPSTTTFNPGCDATVCDNGWFKTKRGNPQQTLCMRLFYHDTTSYDDASLWCNSAHQGFLTGPDSNDEYANIMNQTRYNVDVVGNLTSSTQTMIIIGLKRRPGCETDPGTNPQCNRPEGFMWQDGLGGTSNTLINQNLNSNPGVETSPTAVRACAGILMVTGDYSYSQNKVYSLDCGNAQRSTGLGSRLVVCGKIGQCPSSPPTTVSTSAGTSTTSFSSTTRTVPTTTTTQTPSTTTTTGAPSTSTTTVTTTATSTTTMTTTTTQPPTTTDCPNKVCRYGFYPTVRNGQVWCLRVFFHFVKNNTDAVNYCWNNFHSVLSGPANEVEYNELLNQTETDPNIVTPLSNGYTSVMMVVGAKRTPQCERTIASPCNLPNGYYWQDNVTDSNWMFQNKFNSKGPETNQDQAEACVGVRVFTNHSRRAEELAWSLSCNDAVSAYQVVLKLVVCGHPGVCPGESTTTKLTTTTPSTTTVTTATPTTPTPTTTKYCTKSQLRCAEGWAPFNRSTTRPYCFKVINQYNQTYDDSEALCQSNGGFLSGIENITEYNFVVELAKNSVNYSTSNTSQIIVTIALKRKVICLETNSTESCISFKAYEFVDDDNTHYVSIIQHYNLWADGQPVVVSSEPHRCVGIMVTSPPNANDGKMFATRCETGVQTTGMSNSALCAREPDVCILDEI
ncbi:hypothetical protein CAEBREN_24944 [Caenorhabditis brenneri]|uniref:C-type lectin domain-containing protein n=1 Tax=Caenorhabditis brenneri TaxID=135651 RepID=G0N8N0_CAEBE|nr:hypothetical protein CAEBREN_24944 [Caenorhabditis brenneri]